MAGYEWHEQTDCYKQLPRYRSQLSERLARRRLTTSVAWVQT